MAAEAKRWFFGPGLILAVMMSLFGLQKWNVDTRIDALGKDVNTQIAALKEDVTAGFSQLDTRISAIEGAMAGVDFNTQPSTEAIPGGSEPAATP